MITQEDIDAMNDKADSKDISIEVVEVKEHEDGSATYVFDMNSKTSQIVGEIGLKFLLYAGIMSKSPQKILDELMEQMKL